MEQHKGPTGHNLVDDIETNVRNLVRKVLLSRPTCGTGRRLRLMDPRQCLLNLTRYLVRLSACLNTLLVETMLHYERPQWTGATPFPSDPLDTTVPFLERTALRMKMRRLKLERMWCALEAMIAARQEFAWNHSTFGFFGSHELCKLEIQVRNKWSDHVQPAIELVELLTERKPWWQMLVRSRRSTLNSFILTSYQQGRQKNFRSFLPPMFRALRPIKQMQGVRKARLRSSGLPQEVSAESTEMVEC